MSEPPQEPPQRPDESGQPPWQQEPQWQPPAPSQPEGQWQPRGQWQPQGQWQPEPQWQAGPPAGGGYVPGPLGPQFPTGPQGTYGYPPEQGPPGPSLAERLGARLRVRPEPRFGVSLAGAGMALAIAGLLVWSIGYLADGLHVSFDESGISAHGEGRRFLGAGLAFVVVLLGYGLLVLRRARPSGPLPTAGAIAAAIGVPITLGFLTLDIEGVLRGNFPINLDVVYLVSVLIWLLTYFLVPGARGRAFFLGLALLALPSYLEYKTASSEIFRGVAASVGSGSTNGLGTSASNIGTGGITAIGLIFGLVYYAAAFLLDRRGLRGVAVAFVVAGFFTTASGVVGSVDSFHQIGTGVELIVLGLVLSWCGARAGRRFTTWTWSLLLLVGIVTLVAKGLPDSPTGAGIVLLVIGLVTVAVAAVVASATREPADVAVEGPDVAGPQSSGTYGGRHGAHV